MQLDFETTGSSQGEFYGIAEFYGAGFSVCNSRNTCDSSECVYSSLGKSVSGVLQNLYVSYLPLVVDDSTFVLQRLRKRAQCKLAYRLPSAANLLQRYAFLLKDARNY